MFVCKFCRSYEVAWLGFRIVRANLMRVKSEVLKWMYAKYVVKNSDNPAVWNSLSLSRFFSITYLDYILGTSVLSVEVLVYMCRRY